MTGDAPNALNSLYNETFEHRAVKETNKSEKGDVTQRIILKLNKFGITG